jgi:hypothetical protein
MEEEVGGNARIIGLCVQVAFLCKGYLERLCHIEVRASISKSYLTIIKYYYPKIVHVDCSCSVYVPLGG